MADDHGWMLAGTAVVLAVLLLTALVVLRLGTSPGRIAVVLGGVAAVLAAIPPILHALHG